MTTERFDPYAPPNATNERPSVGGRRWRWGEVVVRSLTVVVGFSLVADPTSMPGVDSPLIRAVGGHVFARAVGLVVLALAFLPWRVPRRSADHFNSDSFGCEVEEL